MSHREILTMFEPHQRQAYVPLLYLKNHMPCVYNCGHHLYYL